MNVQYDRLVAERGKDEADRICDEIEALGGFGGGSSRGFGGIDLTGVLAESNTAIDTKDKARIAELAGVDRKELEKRIEAGRKEMDRGIQSKNNIIPPDMGQDQNRK